MAAVAILSSLAAVYIRNLFHAIFSFGLFLLSVAILFLLLQADFVAMVQIFVYVGGVVVLLLFGFMLVEKAIEKKEPKKLGKKVLALLTSITLLFFLILTLGKSVFPKMLPKARADSTLIIGKSFLTTYLLPFEVVAILLLAAIVGALVIAKEKK